MNKKNIPILILATLFFTANVFCQADTIAYANPIAQEYAELKEADPYVKKVLSLKNDGIKTVLLSIEKTKLSNKKNGFSHLIHNFFLQHFPGPHTVKIGKSVLLLTQEQAPLLHDMIGNLAEKYKIEKPTIFVCPDKNLFNACACSLTKNNGVIIIGEKLLNTLDEKQLKAVLAHELSHIKHNHVMTKLCVTLLGGTVAPLLIWHLLSQQSDRAIGPLRQNVQPWYATTKMKLGAIIAWTIICTLLLLKVSRIMEKEADLDALDITEDSDAFVSMIDALENEIKSKAAIFMDEHDFALEQIKQIKDTNPIRSWLLEFDLKQLKSGIEEGVKQATESDTGTHPSCKTRKEYAKQSAILLLPASS